MCADPSTKIKVVALLSPAPRSLHALTNQPRRSAEGKKKKPNQYLYLVLYFYTLVTTTMVHGSVPWSSWSARRQNVVMSAGISVQLSRF